MLLVLVFPRDAKNRCLGEWTQTTLVERSVHRPSLVVHASVLMLTGFQAHVKSSPAIGVKEQVSVSGSVSASAAIAPPRDDDPQTTCPRDRPRMLQCLPVSEK